MVITPGICQTILCILVPTSIYQGQTNSWINLKNNRNNGNHQSTSFVEQFLTQLTSKNSIINSTINDPNSMLQNTDNRWVAKPIQTWLITDSKFPFRIYGPGTEAKLPPFFESILQRIQTYFSIYRNTEIMRPQNYVLTEEVIGNEVIAPLVSASETEDYIEVGPNLSEEDPFGDFIVVGEDDHVN